ncbi:hypothetical protein MHBO_001990 [Bonamia ostreae]|uniref:Uncharacterized protein n=1 Tax=Bonamia ostreae TaxID=126728 RepID=A0ABV2AL03_9EUKA
MYGLNEQQTENSFCCPIIDIIGFTLDAVFGFIGLIFKSLFDLLEQIEILDNAIDQIKEITSFIATSFPKIVLLIGSVTASSFIISMSFVASFSRYIPRPITLGTSTLFASFGVILLIVVPELIVSTLAFVPFFDFFINLLEGYNYAMLSYLFVGISIVTLAVDTVAEPISPNKPYLFETMVNEVEKDHVDPIHMNEYINRGTEYIASRILSSESNDLNDYYKMY